MSNIKAIKDVDLANLTEPTWFTIRGADSGSYTDLN